MDIHSTSQESVEEADEDNENAPNNLRMTIDGPYWAKFLD